MDVGRESSIMARWLGRVFRRPSPIEIKSSRVQPLLVEPWMRAQGIPHPEAYGAYTRAYRDIVWVYACVRRIAHAAAMVPYRVYTTQLVDGEWRQIEQPKHPAAQLLRRVNPYQTAFDLFEGTVSHLELQGNAYWEVVRDGRGKPAELYLLDPRFMRPVPDPERYLLGWIYSVNGQKVSLDTRDVVHLRYFNPEDEYYGLSTISAARSSIIIDRLGTDWNRSMLENSSVPGGVLEPVGDVPIAIDPAEREAIRQEWERLQRGPKKAGRVAVLSGLRYRQVSINPRDMEWLQQKKLTREEICAVFGVPPMLVGIHDRSTYSNYDAALRDFWANTMLPRLEKIGQALSEKYVSLWGDDTIGRFDTSGIAALQENEAERTRIEVERVTAGLESINEVRARRGQPPVPWGDTWWRPISLQPADGTGATAPPLPAQDGQRRLWTPVSGSGASSIDVRELPPITWDPYDPRIVQTRGMEDEWIRALRRYWADEANQLLDALARWPAKAISPDDETALHDLLQLLLLRKSGFADLVTPFLAQGVDMGGKKAYEELGIELDWRLVDKRTVDFLAHYGAFLADAHYDTTREALRATLMEGLAAGETIELLKARVQAVYSDLNDSGAELIARTEAIRAANAGKVAGYRQSGVVRAKQWITVGDDRTCPYCESMAGRVIDLDANYLEKGDVVEAGGRRMSASYAPVAYPPLHPRCRCTLVAVF